MPFNLNKHANKIVISTVVLSLLLLGVLVTPNPSHIPLTPEESLWLKTHDNQIRLAPCPGWEPMEFFDKKSGYRGMVADYIKLIEKKLGFRFKIVKYDSWSQIIREAQKGNVDVIAAAHATPERWEFMNWTDPYLEFPAVIITKKSDPKNYTLDQMIGMRVGVCKGYIVENYIRNTFPDVELFPFDMGIEGLEKVSFGELEAMIMELPNAFYNIDHNKITNLRMAGKTKWIAKYGIGTRKNIPHLHSIMQKALTMITPYEKREIRSQWIDLGQSYLLYKRTIWFVAAACLAIILVIIASVVTWNFTLKQKVEEATSELQEELKERVRVEAHTQKLEDQLRQAHKMEAIGTLAGGIAHDFNNILGTIIGYAEMIELFDGPLPEKTQQRLKHILTAGYRAKDLVNHILTFARQSDQKKTPVSLTPVIKETVKLIQVLLPPKVKVVLTIDDPEITVLAHPVQIHQIIMNLCTNAAHAIGDSQAGTISISLSSKNLDPHQATEYLGLGPGQYASLCIKDTGPGISPDIKDKIFDPFFTTKPAGKGTGMGLPVVHGIVKSCFGYIGLKSPLDQGAIIEILLPEIESQKSESENNLSLKDNTKSDKTILIIDDDPDMLSMSTELLKEMGYNTIFEKDAEKALEKFKQAPFAVDLVFTDLIMPKISGEHLAWRMKLIRPDICVVLCSGGIDRKKAEQIMNRFGIEAFVQKPLRIKELKEIIEAYLQPLGPDSNKA